MIGGQDCLKQITALLEAAGVEWSIERRSKHMLVKVGDETVAALSQGSRVKFRTSRNTVARVRRFLRERGENV